jgi:hypothetical protein
MPEQLVRLVNPSPSQTNHSLIANTSLTNHSVTDEVTALREVVAHVHLTVSVLRQVRAPIHRRLHYAIHSRDR